MAHKARRACPDITGHFAVVIVHLGLAVLVAIDATKRRRSRGYSVTIDAIEAAVRPVIDRERVVEHRVAPSKHIVALHAVGAKPRRRVIRVGRCVVVIGMTCGAIGRRGREIAVDVTLRAIGDIVPANKLEAHRVFKTTGPPTTSIVTQHAVSAKSRSYVIWISRRVVLRRVTRGAIRREPQKCARHVTLGAIEPAVTPCQRKASRVIKLRRLPIDLGVTPLAIRNPAVGDVIGINDRRCV